MTEADTSVFCQCPPIYETEYRPRGERSPTTVILHAISKAENEDVLDLPPLYEIIDSDGIDRIFFDADDETVLAFSYGDLKVHIRGDGQIRICDATKQAEVAPVFERPMT